MPKNVDFTLVGNLLSSLRIKSNLSQQDLADELGVSKAAISQWENGSGIKTEKLYEIANYFDVTVTELINGQLNDEDEKEYFGRNYDLSNHPSFDVVDKNNVEDLIDYFCRCKNVINRFFKLFNLSKTKKINSKQADEFRKLEEYFEKDYKYLDFCNLIDYSQNLDRLITELKETQGYVDEQLMDFELQKIFSLKIEVNSIAALKYSDEIAKQYLSLLTAQQKDTLLTDYLTNIEEDIEKSDVVRRLLDNGAQCLFTLKSIRQQSFYSSDDLNSFFGAIKEDKQTNTINEYFMNNESRIYSGKNAYIETDSWKLFTKKDYSFLIDKERTLDLRNIVYFKSKNPVKYYQYIINRDKNKLL